MCAMPVPAPFNGGVIRNALRYHGPTSTATHDAEITVPDGGAKALQGTLQVKAACVQTLGHDGTPQWSTWTTPGATEYWQAQGGLTGLGASLYATNAASTGNVSGQITAQENGSIYAANGTGIICAFASASPPLASTDYVTIQPGTSATNPMVSSTIGTMQVNAPTGQNVAMSSGGIIVAEFGGVQAAPSTAGCYALIGTRADSNNIYYSSGGNITSNIEFQAGGVGTVFLLNQSGNFAAFRNSDLNTTGSSFDFQAGEAARPLQISFAGTGLGQLLIGQAHTPISVGIGGGQLDPAATTGFLQIPYCAGTPTGVPNPATGGAPIVYDTTHKKLWIYDTVANAWKGAAFT